MSFPRKLFLRQLPVVQQNASSCLGNVVIRCLLQTVAWPIQQVYVWPCVHKKKKKEMLKMAKGTFSTLANFTGGANDSLQGGCVCVFLGPPWLMTGLSSCFCIHKPWSSTNTTCSVDLRSLVSTVYPLSASRFAENFKETTAGEASARNSCLHQITFHILFHSISTAF